MKSISIIALVLVSLLAVAVVAVAIPPNPVEALWCVAGTSDCFKSKADCRDSATGTTCVKAPNK
jgi:hypothetical protein